MSEGAESTGKSAAEYDVCAHVGPDQRWAWVWFFAVLVVGSSVTYGLANIDSYLYSVKGRVLDYEAYRDNRMAATGIGSDSIDPRQLAPIAVRK
jgi:hypothetical protein